MRIRARLLLGLYGLVLVVPTIAAAAPLSDDEAGYAVAGGQPAPQPAPTITRDCSDGGTVSSASARMSRPMMAWMLAAPAGPSARCHNPRAGIGRPG